MKPDANEAEDSHRPLVGEKETESTQIHKTGILLLHSSDVTRNPERRSEIHKKILD